MILTEKCKEDFEKWFFTIPYHYCQEHLQDEYLKSFYDLPNSMKYGVYLDFFDIKEIYISVSGLVLSKTYIWDIGRDSNVEFYGEGFKTIHEARTGAIKKANEIYNK